MHRAAAAVLSLAPLALAGCAGAPAARSAPSAPLLYVTNEVSNDLTIIDTGRDEVVGTIAPGKRPRAVRLSPDGKTLYVAVSGTPLTPPGYEGPVPPADHAADGIAAIDLASRKVARVIACGDDPEVFDLSPDGRRMYVSNEAAGTATIVDVASGDIVGRAQVGGQPEGIAVRPDGAAVYVTSEEDSRVTALGPAGEVLGSFQTRKRPRQVLFTPDGARAFVSAEQGRAVEVADARAHRLLQTIVIDDPDAKPMGLALTPDGRTLWVSNGRGDTVTAIEVASLKPVATYPTDGTRPWGIALTADGKKLYTANGTSNDVSVMDPATGRVLKRIPVGEKPWGLAVGR
ncbi:MAG TPA: beta-propeller fold lactonase family protein [Anaeromyxobacteraceae bacterium]|nr:beta-propeller fold lactonase family protein [Anaeromyxobacteraceae bacterium]